MMIDFNINQHVKVKLTKSGISELERQHKKMDLNQPFELPPTDSEGYTTFQLHMLMKKFGHLMGIGTLDSPFEASIKVCLE